MGRANCRWSAQRILLPFALSGRCETQRTSSGNRSLRRIRPIAADAKDEFVGSSSRAQTRIEHASAP
jgi:hypothetical protein